MIMIPILTHPIEKQIEIIQTEPIEKQIENI